MAGVLAGGGFLPTSRGWLALGGVVVVVALGGPVKPKLVLGCCGRKPVGLVLMLGFSGGLVLVGRVGLLVGLGKGLLLAAETGTVGLVGARCPKRACAGSFACGCGEVVWAVVVWDVDGALPVAPVGLVPFGMLSEGIFLPV